MFRSTGLLAGICLALFIVYTPVAKPQGDNLRDAGVVTAVPQEIPDGIVGYRTEDGGKTWIPIKEEKGIAERIPSGTTKAEFMAAHKMDPEAEAAIVHQAPPVPVIIDGILYEPEQIHLVRRQAARVHRRQRRRALCLHQPGRFGELHFRADGAAFV